MGRFKGKLFNLGLSAAVREKQSNDIGMEQAYSETYQVLQHATLGIIKQIPNSFMDFLRKNMDATWSGNLDFSKNLMEMDLLWDTRVLLSLVYRDFLCSETERKILVVKERKEVEAAGMIYEDESLRDLFKADD